MDNKHGFNDIRNIYLKKSPDTEATYSINNRFIITFSTLVRIAVPNNPLKMLKTFTFH